MIARLINRLTSAVIVALGATVWSVQAAEDPLASWNDGAAKQAILDFVAATTSEGGPSFVPPAVALAGPMTAFLYDWNMLPIGQQLWLKELESYKEFPPLQAPATYNLAHNLEGILDQIKRISREQ